MNTLLLADNVKVDPAGQNDVGRTVGLTPHPQFKLLVDRCRLGGYRRRRLAFAFANSIAAAKAHDGKQGNDYD
jgi:hypothetical protein